MLFRSSKKFDLVVSHFPFGSSAKNDLEFGFLGKSLSMLRKKGSLICIVPEKVLINNSYFELRRKIVNEYSLEIIINLPKSTLKNVFVKTAILVIRNKYPRKQVLLTTYHENEDEIIKQFKSGSLGQWIPFHKMLDRWDLDYHDPKYKIVEKELQKHDSRPLSELGTIMSGIHLPREKIKSYGKFLIFSDKNIHQGKFTKTEFDKYTDRLELKKNKKYIIQKGDIIIPSIFKDRKILHVDDEMPQAIVGQNCYLIRSPNNDYLQTYLQSSSPT